MYELIFLIIGATFGALLALIFTGKNLTCSEHNCFTTACSKCVRETAYKDCNETLGEDKRALEEMLKATKEQVVCLTAFSAKQTEKIKGMEATEEELLKIIDSQEKAIDAQSKALEAQGQKLANMIEDCKARTRKINEIGKIIDSELV